MIKVKNEKSFVQVVITYFIYIILLLTTINLFRSYLMPNFDMSKDFIGFKSLLTEFVRFISSFNVQVLIDNLYKAFIIDIPDISQVESFWELLTGTIGEIADLVMFPLHIINFLSEIVISLFRFLSVFFGLQLPTS